jgi:hypothetical protein
MSIDGIGKKGTVPIGSLGDAGAASTTNAVGGAAKTRGETFEVGSAQRPLATSASTAFEEVRAGRLPVDTYLDNKVSQATQGLHGLPEHELAFIQKTLRAELATDPTLAEWVRQATGAVPSLPEE